MHRAEARVPGTGLAACCRFWNIINRFDLPVALYLLPLTLVALAVMFIVWRFNAGNGNERALPWTR